MKADLLPSAWTPPASMVRIIAHWSEGRAKANDTDKLHYHLLVEGGATPRLIRGDHSIADNASTGDGVYAAHTRGCNTGSIGIALCGMMGCEESPFEAGTEPITLAQWSLMVQAIAALCQRYGIKVTPKTVLCHGEVQRNLGIRQNGKWDPMRWPWAPEVPGHRIGDLLREAVSDVLMGGEVQESATVPAPIKRTVSLPGGTSFTFPEVRVDDGDTLVALRPVCEALGWVIEETAKGKALVNIVPLLARHSESDQGTVREVALEIVEGTGYASVRELASLMGASVSWDAKSKAVVLTMSESKESK